MVLVDNLSSYNYTIFILSCTCTRKPNYTVHHNYAALATHSCTCSNGLWLSGRSCDVDDLTVLSDNHPLHHHQPPPSSSSDVVMTSPFSVTSSTSGGQLSCPSRRHISRTLSIMVDHLIWKPNTKDPKSLNNMCTCIQQIFVAQC